MMALYQCLMTRLVVEFYMHVFNGSFDRTFNDVLFVHTWNDFSWIIVYDYAVWIVFY